MDSPGEHWHAAVADDALRRVFADPDHDDGDWEPVPVPGHWRSTAAFSSTDGPLLYRTRFEQAPGSADRRWWLRFEGIFTDGDVWLDGAYLGDTTGAFAPHTFEVTRALRDRSEHVLAVEVASAPAGVATADLTGALSDPAVVGAGTNPGGIWRPVHLRSSGPVHLHDLVVRCTEATGDRAVLCLTAQLDAAHAVAAHLHTTVGGVEVGTDRPLAAGINTVEWVVEIPRPRLWWPHALGDAPLEWVTVEVELDDGAVSDRRRLRTGLRHVAWDRGVLSVNGERLFCKGVTLLPTDARLGERSAAECRADVFDARRAGLDLVRVHTHVARAETYDAADAHGVLVWQDLPVRGRLPGRLRRRAERQAVAVVRALAHHPSIALWCGRDDPGDRGDGRSGGVTTRLVLDRSVARVLDRTDGSRPVLLRAGADLAFGRQRGDAGSLARRARIWPARMRFVSELGAGDTDPETLRLQVEALRRLKYRPTGGFCEHAFSGPCPAPAAALDAFVRACRPVVVVADPLPSPLTPGEPVAVDVHLVSDRREPAEGRVTVTLRWDGGAHRWDFAGEVPADGCVLVGTVQFEAPDAVGDLRLELTGDVGDQAIDNCYRSEVAAAEPSGAA